jgi:hypothetical protein
MRLHLLSFIFHIHIYYNQYSSNIKFHTFSLFSHEIIKKTKFNPFRKKYFLRSYLSCNWIVCVRIVHIQQYL